MPKIFSEEEKEKIRNRLIQNGAQLFGENGVRKTTIDELILGAGIGKGTFYKFYDSKERLFMDVLKETEKNLAKQIEKTLSDESIPPKTRFKEFLRFHYRSIATNPIIRIPMDKDEMAQIMNGGSVEDFLASREYQNSFLPKFVRDWQKRGLIIPVDPEVLLTFMKMAVFIGLHKEHAGPRYPEMLDFAFDMMADYLIIDKKPEK